MIVLIIMAVIAFVDFLVLWIPCYMDHAYDDEPVEVSNNKDFNFSLLGFSCRTRSYMIEWKAG